jgi:hypothetical protein
MRAGLVETGLPEATADGGWAASDLGKAGYGQGRKFYVGVTGGWPGFERLAWRYGKYLGRWALPVIGRKPPLRWASTTFAGPNGPDFQRFE